MMSLSADNQGAMAGVLLPMRLPLENDDTKQYSLLPNLCDGIYFLVWPEKNDTFLILEII